MIFWWFLMIFDGFLMVFWWFLMVFIGAMLVLAGETPSNCLSEIGTFLSKISNSEQKSSKNHQKPSKIIKKPSKIYQNLSKVLAGKNPSNHLSEINTFLSKISNSEQKSVAINSININPRRWKPQQFSKWNQHFFVKNHQKPSKIIKNSSKTIKIYQNLSKIIKIYQNSSQVKTPAIL